MLNLLFRHKIISYSDLLKPIIYWSYIQYA
jgi:hypothetical protein